MSKFEDTLWADLAEHHGADLAHLPESLPRKEKRTGRVIAVAAGVVAVAGAGVIVGPSFFGGSPPAAYAVERAPDGTVTVTLREMLGALDPVNAKLREMGVPVVVVPARPDCRDMGQRVHPGPPDMIITIPVSVSSDGFTYHPEIPTPLGLFVVVGAAQYLGKDGRTVTTFATGGFRDRAPSCAPSTRDEGPAGPQVSTPR
ncbi:hypothetical protein EV193_10833 [Herbihabitans rhizosphaerae]|uniref:Uncharacterized protein n=1 Tax=Herbihabitans rhizosphaerae TaxID=1872711 RepID=A0A4Q7KKA5_9PSEU|nr:hypothetical protein [Herbihabitans rhizosphaerae]RZS34685.1 hypothetical protein EV193_10833 [Herbihabitans rhizosphaerae]